MEKEFVPHQEALDLKQLGFDEAISTYYSFPNIELSYVMDGHSKVSFRRNSQFGYAVSAPTYSQAFRFFREKFNLEYQIIKSASDSYSAVIHLNTREYLDKILTLSNACVDEVVDCYSYEEAELECVRKLIEIVKNK
jgi:hypothetical protein